MGRRTGRFASPDTGQDGGSLSRCANRFTSLLRGLILALWCRSSVLLYTCTAAHLGPTSDRSLRLV